MAEELQTFYILVPFEKQEQFLKDIQQRSWQVREVLPGEYFPPKEAFERPRRKRNTEPDSDERKAED